jgi:Cu2+-exporting ATPase
VTTVPSCDLCDLPTPTPPVAEDGVDGTFCCRGCLEIARTLDGETEQSVDSPADVRDSLDADRTSRPDTDGETAFLAVDGMHCTTCEAFLEATVTDRDGVLAADANYASELMKVEYDPDAVSDEELPDVVSGLGYDANRIEETASTDGGGTPWRAVIGGISAMVAMPWYLTLYPTYLGLVPEPKAGIAPLAPAVIWVAASVLLFYTGAPILRSAYVSLRSGYPNMDLLIALAAGGAYLYSGIVVLLGGIEVYFDITIVVVLVVTLGNHYEEGVKRSAVGSLADLTEERVDEARRRGEDGTEWMPVDDLEGGDEVVVKSGERVPADGHVVEGTAAVDESIVTGESRPAQQSVGDEVVGGSVVTDSPLVIEVAEGGESTIDRLVTLLWSIQSSKPGAQRVADRLATVFVPVVVLLAGAAFVSQLVGGTAFSTALVTGLSVLIVACPCALGLATPLAVAAGVRAALERGIVMTNESVFETATDVDIVLFDKTGTLTTGEMHLVDPGARRARRYAAAVEQYANHPVADAITDYTSPPDVDVSEFEQYPGRGVGADVDGSPVLVGNLSLFEDQDWTVTDDIGEQVRDARTDGNVPIVVGWNGRAESVIAAGDQPRENWSMVVETLAEDGRRIMVVTGDDEAATTPFRDHPAVAEVFADVPPEAKSELVHRLRVNDTVGMIGDGTNDAPALASADLGIALESGTALAADAADVVVTNDDLTSLPAVFETTAATSRRIRQNLGWAFLYNGIAIPVAMAGVLNPLVAAVAMGLSSLLVVGNSARSFPVAGAALTDSD